MSVAVSVRAQLQNLLISLRQWNPSLDCCIFAICKRFNQPKNIWTLSTSAETSFEGLQVSFEHGGVTTLYPTEIHTTSNIFQVDKMNREGAGKKIIQRKSKLETEKRFSNL